MNMKELLKGWNTIPNWLSYIRIALIPVFADLFYKGYVGWAMLVLTQITIAIMFYIEFRTSSEELIKTFSWVFLIFVIKEFVMVFFGGLMLAMGLRPAAAEIYGKAATMVFYLVMIAIVMFGPDIGFLKEYWTIPDVAMLVLVIVSAVLTVVAFCSYLPSAAKQIIGKIKSRK